MSQPPPQRFTNVIDVLVWGAPRSLRRRLRLASRMVRRGQMLQFIINFQDGDEIQHVCVAGIEVNNDW